MGKQMVCCLCEKRKSIKFFSGEGVKAYICIECEDAPSPKHVQQNRDRMKKYRVTHPEVVRERINKWRRENKDKVNAQQRGRYKKRKEKLCGQPNR